MFNLEQSIAEWRRQMHATENIKIYSRLNKPVKTGSNSDEM